MDFCPASPTLSTYQGTDGWRTIPLGLDAGSAFVPEVLQLHCGLAYCLWLAGHLCLRCVPISNAYPRTRCPQQCELRWPTLSGDSSHLGGDCVCRLYQCYRQYTTSKIRRPSAYSSRTRVFCCSYPLGRARQSSGSFRRFQSVPEYGKLAHSGPFILDWNNRKYFCIRRYGFLYGCACLGSRTDGFDAGADGAIHVLLSL